MAETIVFLHNHAAIAQEMWIPIGEMNRAAGEASSPKYYPGRSTSPDYFDPSRGACLLAQVYIYIYTYICIHTSISARIVSLEDYWRR